MATMSELYQSVILDHNRAPRNYRAMEGADRRAVGHNPLCGDQLTVWLKLGPGDAIEDVTFQGSGCAISKASASMMTAAVKGKSREEVLALFHQFHALVTGEPTAPSPPLGKLAVFGGVAEFPIRVKCASLSWHALKAALEHPDAVITTDTDASHQPGA
jgi:nitrogen fixation NifU-like protein